MPEANYDQPIHSGTEQAVPFRAIANYTYDWETWVDAEGAVRWINPAVERITGYGAGECLAMADYPLAIVHPEDRSAMARHLASASQGGSGNHEEFRIIRKDGAVRWGAVSWQPIADDDGRPAGYRTSVRDVTDTKRIENALRDAYREAENADRAKTRFLAAASHDLRQPLQAIAMFAGALKAGSHDGETVDLAGRIQECLVGANELLSALLDVSRLDAGVLAPNPRDFIACDLMERIEVEFAEQASTRNLVLRLVPSTAIVHTDPALLHRIVGNLVANAVRYTDRGGVLLGCRRHGRNLRFEVRDTGPGIAPELRERIFEEFFQIGNPERDRQRGLGLGLAIVRRLAALLGLELGLDSEPGRGSVFWISVPLAENQDRLVEQDLSVLPEVPELTGRRIMVIDDDPMQVEALSRLLAGWGCAVVSADSAASARAILRDGMPEAILADYRLRGDETGTEAVHAVRRAAGAEIPAILVTGDTEPARLARAAESGLSLLAKPVTAEELLAAVSEALNQGIPAQPSE